MTTPLPYNITQLLINWSGDDDRQAPDKLLPPVRNEWRRLADRHLRRGRSDHNLQCAQHRHDHGCSPAAKAQIYALMDGE